MYTIEQAGVQQSPAVFNKEFHDAFHNRFGSHLDDALQAGLGIIVAVVESQGSIAIPEDQQPAGVDVKDLKDVISFIIKRTSLPVGWDDQGRVVWLSSPAGDE